MRNGSVIPQIEPGHKRRGAFCGAPCETLLGWLEGSEHGLAGRVLETPTSGARRAAGLGRFLAYRVARFARRALAED